MKNIDKEIQSTLSIKDIANKVSQGIDLKNLELTGVPTYIKRQEYFKQNGIAPIEHYDLTIMSEQIGREEITWKLVQELAETWMSIPKDTNEQNARLLRSSLSKMTEKWLRKNCGIFMDEDIANNLTLSDGTILQKGIVLNQKQMEEMRKIDYLFLWKGSPEDTLHINRLPLMGIDHKKNIVVILPGICY